MKRSALVLLVVFILAALVAVPSSSVFAAADATCTVDPESGPIDTVFNITCWGFDPNTWLYAYIVEPDGAASYWGAIKSDASGYIYETFETRWGDEATAGLGKWTFVVEQTGLAKSVIHRGEVSFVVTGGTEGVSGAWLTADPSTLQKDDLGFDHDNFKYSQPGVFIDITNNEPHWTGPVTVSGGGFAPYEMVTFWVENPGGECSSFTAHYHSQYNFSFPPVATFGGEAVENEPWWDGTGTFVIDTVKADAAGNVSLDLYVLVYACEGVYRVVGRGNASGWGGETWVTVVGNPISTNAWLYADPGVVGAMFEKVWFYGGGFGANERLDCWITTPQGRSLAFPFDSWDVGWYIVSGFIEERFRDVPIVADGAGNVGFELVTGSYYAKVNEQGTYFGNPYSIAGEFFDPVASEGALGEYAMTCRGWDTGNTAIARYTVTGGPVDP